jgi:predicted AAA+ superfamily ATPase
MAVSNRERVGRVMDALKVGLGPYIVREYRMLYKDVYFDEINSTLIGTSHPGFPDSARSNESALLESLDTQACFTLMWRQWKDIFQDKLGHTSRSYVSILIDARNKWAHQEPFTNEEAYRAADTAGELLKAVNAGEQTQRVKKIASELLRLRYEQEAEKARREAVPETVETTTTTGLMPWRDVTQPHQDVASGKYIQAEFVADFAQVLTGNAEIEYQDPIEFFNRTYLTEGLLDLLVTGVKRLTAQGGDPIVQLQTAFGGGKTHSMLALYHLCGGQIKLSDFSGGERISDQIGDVDLPESNIAVLVGTDQNAAEPRNYPDAVVNTLWGEIAYQLGGIDAYKLVENADQRGVSPGSSTLNQIFDQFGPCLVIIDELVAYARNMYKVDGLPAGSFDSLMTFIQSLTEAVRRTDDSMLLISIPESDIEIGGEAGRIALDMISHIVGRIESVWKPVTPTESFEIVRRRLFTPEIDFAARDAVAEAFVNMYRNNSGEFPGGVSERDYLDRIKSAYPIHPELFERLYMDWSTLDRFQRTRGVLRFMAAVIHQLWSRGNPSLLILPGTVPLDAAKVKDELLRYLTDPWNAVTDTDVDGIESQPFKIDGSVPAIGRFNAARRVARTIFIGTAPSVAAQTVRGLEEVRIRLGCAQPGEPTAVFGDALRRMGGQLTHLYSDGNRYWYDTRPTVNKLARDRAQGFSLPEVYEDIKERLLNVSKNRDFAAFHVAPIDTSNVVDEPRARVVVLHPEITHKRTTAETEAEKEVLVFLESRGSSQRLYKNMLVFIAPDEHDSAALIQAVREHLAWKSIDDQKEELNLDAQQRRQVTESCQKTDETVGLRLQETYNWLLVPTQPDPIEKIEIQSNRIRGEDNFYDSAARKLRNDGLLIYEWSPDILRMELDNILWNEERGWQVKLKQLWDYFAQYCYLPRLFDSEVLVQAVKNGVIRLDAPFAYATGMSKDGYHTGLIFRELGNVYFDENSLIVHPEHISRPPEVEPEGTSDVDGEAPEPGDEPEVVEPPKKLTTRYYGRVEIDPQRINKDMGVIVEEVIERLTSQLNCEVEINMEIGARKGDGFDESAIRTISENSRTLKFEDFGFEEN